MTLQINITTQVNSKNIRTETVEGRRYYVIPSYTLPSGVVMNDILYTAEEIDAHYEELEDTLAPLGHPFSGGAYVSAFSPEGINGFHVGAFNRNVEKRGNRVYVEKWVDIDVAARTENGRKLIDRIAGIVEGREESKPIHTSVAAFIEKEPAPNNENGYSWVAHIHKLDHDAILLDAIGAATPAQGVGMMVNADTATPLGCAELSSLSYLGKRALLEEAINTTAKGNDTDGSYPSAHVIDFTDSEVLVHTMATNGEYTASVRKYAYDSGKIKLLGFDVHSGTSASWIKSSVNALANLTAKMFNQPSKKETTKERTMTPEEKAALLNEITANTNRQLDAAVNTLTEQLNAVIAKQDSIAVTLAANTKQSEAYKRKFVESVHGAVVANALSGEALEEVYTTITQRNDTAPAAIGTEGSKGASDGGDFTAVVD